MPAEAELILFGIQAALRINQQFRHAFADSTRSHGITLPLPNFPAALDRSSMENFYRFGDGKEFARTNLRVRELLIKLSATGDLAPEEDQEFCRLFREHNAVILASGPGLVGTGENPAGVTDQDILYLVTIRQWREGHDPNPTMLRRMAGTLVNIAVDYVVEMPGVISTNTARGKALLSFLEAFENIDFAEDGRALRRKSKVEVEIETWFDTVMDRSTERFILCARWITAAIAFILALGLHIDSIQIFKQLSIRSDVRARMVQQVDATLDKAGSLVSAAKEPKPLASEAIRAIEEDLKDSKDLEILRTVPGNLVTRRAGEEWLQGRLTGPRLTKGLEAYKRRFDEATVAQLGDLKTSFNEVKSSLDQTGLQIIPQPLPGWKDYPGDRGLHLLGLLMTGLFLSLGAPFWYNALSRLANLRPVLAGKVEAQVSGEREKSGTP